MVDGIELLPLNNWYPYFEHEYDSHSLELEKLAHQATKEMSFMVFLFPQCFRKWCLLISSHGKVFMEHFNVAKSTTEETT